MVGTVKEFILNTIGLTLMQIEIHPEFHDNLMAKIDKWFWPGFIYAVVGILSYLI